MLPCLCPACLLFLIFLPLTLIRVPYVLRHTRSVRRQEDPGWLGRDGLAGQGREGVVGRANPEAAHGGGALRDQRQGVQPNARSTR